MATSRNKKSTSETQIIRITEWSNDRSKQDIKTWRNALAQAEHVLMPRRWELDKLYRELELDAHIIMLMNRYRRHLTGRAFVLRDKKTGKTDAEATKLLQKRWFYDLLKSKSDSKFFGHSLMQIDELNAGEIKKVSLIKRKFLVPEQGGYIQQQGSGTVINYRDNPELMKWLFEADNNDFGYLNPAAPYVLFKKNAMVAWSEFCEVFGLPIRYVETNNTTPKDITRLKNNLINMGKSAYGIFQTGEAIKFAEVTRTDSYNVFNQLKEACNMELSKMVLGETMTSDVGANGGNRALGEVHQQTSNETAEENRSDAMTWANEHVMPMLNVHGYKFENLEFDYPQVPDFGKGEWLVFEGLLRYYDIDPAFFIDRYGVPLAVKQKHEPDPAALSALLKDAANTDYSKYMQLHAHIASLYGDECCPEHQIVTK